MGLFGDGKLEEAREYGILQAKVEYLERENKDLRDRCTKLQESVDSQMQTIIAIQHPESYRMLQEDRAVEDNDGMASHNREKWSKGQRILAEFAHEQEQPLFRSPDDVFAVMDKFSKSQMKSPDNAGQSLHSNSES